MAAAVGGARTPGQLFALVFGAVYVLVGLLGFFNDPILGTFDVNLLHNLIHLVVGAAFLVGSTQARLARTINLSIGIVYALVALLGFLNVLVPDLIKANNADDFLHLGTAVLAIYFGTASGMRPAPAAPAA